MNTSDLTYNTEPVLNKERSMSQHKKWGGKTELNPKKKGMWKGKDEADIEKVQSALRKEKDHTPAETTKLREANFAIEAKKHWGKAEGGKVLERSSGGTDDDDESWDDKLEHGMRNAASIASNAATIGDVMGLLKNGGDDTPDMDKDVETNGIPHKTTKKDGLKHLDGDNWMGKHLGPDTAENQPHLGRKDLEMQDQPDDNY